MLRHVPHWPVPEPRQGVESLAYRLASLRRPADAIGETLSLTVTLLNEQRILIPQAVVRWSRGQEFAVENLAIEPHNVARLEHYVKRLVQEPTENVL
jgi:hypothetical protein